MASTSDASVYLSLLDKLADLVIRKAVGYEVTSANTSFLPRSLAPFIDNLLRSLPSELVEKSNGIYRCKLCGKGPFTRKGLYLHLKRVHIDQVVDMVKSELDYYIWRLKNYPE